MFYGVVDENVGSGGQSGGGEENGGDGGVCVDYDACGAEYYVDDGIDSDDGDYLAFAKLWGNEYGFCDRCNWSGVAVIVLY